MLTISLIISAVMAVLPLADGHEYQDGIISGHEGGEYASSEHFYKNEGHLYGDSVPFKNIPDSDPVSNEYNLHANVMASVDYRHWSVSEKLSDCECQQCNSCGSDDAPDSPPEECDCSACSGCDDVPTPPEEEVEPIDLEALRQEIEDLRQEIEDLREDINNEPEVDLREMLEEELERKNQALQGKELELAMEERRRAFPRTSPHVPASECTCGCLDPDSSPSGSGSSETCDCEIEYKWPTYAWASSWADVYFTQDTSPTQEFDDSIPMEVFAKAWALDEVDEAQYADRSGSDDTEHPLTYDAQMKSEQQELEDENGMLTTPTWIFQTPCAFLRAHTSSRILSTRKAAANRGLKRGRFRTRRIS